MITQINDSEYIGIGENIIEIIQYSNASLGNYVDSVPYVMVDNTMFVGGQSSHNFAFHISESIKDVLEVSYDTFD